MATRGRARRNGILPAGTSVAGPWGAVNTPAQHFATRGSVLHVKCVNPFDAGVGRKRRRWGVVSANQLIVSWRGRRRGWGGLDAILSVPGSSTAVSTNARNNATLRLLYHLNAHAPHLVLRIVLVGRAPLHRLPLPLLLLRIRIRLRHVLPAQILSPPALHTHV